MAPRKAEIEKQKTKKDICFGKDGLEKGLSRKKAVSSEFFAMSVYYFHYSKKN